MTEFLRTNPAFFKRIAKVNAFMIITKIYFKIFKKTLEKIAIAVRTKPLFLKADCKDKGLYYTGNIFTLLFS